MSGPRYKRTVMTTIPKANDNAHAMKKVGDRLESEVGATIKWAKSLPIAPFWVLVRSLFPIAESIAYLLLLETETETKTKSSAKQLSGFFNNQLSEINPDYASVSHIVCQIWRHGLIHGDEAPIIRMSNSDSKYPYVMSWMLTLSKDPRHLKVLRYGPAGQVVFSLEDFFDDLVTVCRNPNSISSRLPGEVAKRYNEWGVKELTLKSKIKEESEAATQLKTILFEQ